MHDSAFKAKVALEAVKGEKDNSGDSEYLRGSSESGVPVEKRAFGASSGNIRQ